MVLGTANGWQNYSITSEPCRAYDLLINAGVSSDHLIYMSYTENYKDKYNPFPYTMYTDPGSGDNLKDYAKQCYDHFDYKDEDITPELFIALLSGDEEKVKSITGKTNPKVLKSTEEDSIFIYFIDHGDEDLIYVGEGIVTSTQLIESIQSLHMKHMYKDLVFFMEACHSGSMFKSLPKGLNTYIFTSSMEGKNAAMSNCPPYDRINGIQMDTCLGGLYDNLWMSKVENTNQGNISLYDIYTYVFEEVRYKSGQTPSLYGDIESMKSKLISEFIGTNIIVNTTQINTSSSSSNTPHGIIPLDQVPLHLAKWKAIRSSKEQLNNEMNKLVALQLQEIKHDIIMMKIAIQYTHNEIIAQSLHTLSANKYDQHCYINAIQNLMKKCHFSIPLKEDHSNIIKNLCSLNNNNDLNVDTFCI
ncbi:hypothetical protein WA158_001028 [Blastocystis sp. Blastoise]